MNYIKNIKQYLNEEINPLDPYNEENWDETTFKRGQKVKEKNKNRS